MITPPTLAPPAAPVGLLKSVRMARRNALAAIPGIAFERAIISRAIGHMRWHMLQGPDGLKRVFVDHVDNYPKSEMMLRMLRPAVGKSLFTTDGAEWRWQRRAVNPVFAHNSLTAIAPVMAAAAEQVSNRIAGHNGPIDVVREMLSATLAVIVDVALSASDKFDSPKFADAITAYLHNVGRASLFDFLDLPAWLPSFNQLRGATSVRSMRRIVAQTIGDHRSKVQSNAHGDGNNLLDQMLQAEDPETGRRLSEREILDNMVFFVVAGHETTALTLAWALYLLALDARTQQNLRDAARSVLGDRVATLDDVPRIANLDQVLQETMRLYPPVGVLSRRARNSDQLYDRDIGAGETVFLNIYGLHRHKLLWDHPDAFNPDNFLPGPAKNHHRFQYLPFGAGPRKCLGAEFAMMQASIILSTLVARFEFSHTGPAPLPVMHLTVRPEPPIQLLAKPVS